MVKSKAVKRRTVSAPLKSKKTVYVVGAGLSVGLGYPTVQGLLPQLWQQMKAGSDKNQLKRVIEFHNPDFNPNFDDSFPNFELLLTQIFLNIDLYDYSRTSPGILKKEDLEGTRDWVLRELCLFFLRLAKKNTASTRPEWFRKLIKKMRAEDATVVSFNYDLEVDRLLLRASDRKSGYGFHGLNDTRLIKPHGSLNWCSGEHGKKIRSKQKTLLFPKSGSSSPDDELYLFHQSRFPRSRKGSFNNYIPKIVPPVWFKDLKAGYWKPLWQALVHSLSAADNVYFLGFEQAPADLHARFMVRCGFHNQLEGEIPSRGAAAKGPAELVTIVNPRQEAYENIKASIGTASRTVFFRKTIEQWVDADFA